MALEGSIAAEALQSVQSFLADKGSSLAGQGLEAITALLDTLEAGLNGELDPVYYLSSIDPGMGKTLSVSMFLKAWKGRGFLPASSVLIAVSRLTEIEAYVGTSGLNRSDFGVLTSNEASNALGVVQENIGRVPILFTSQQMIESRLRNKTFGGASEFHYQDEPRTLRIWDESFVPGDPQTLSLDQLGQLATPLRFRHRKYIEAVEGLQETMRQATPGEVIEVPESLGSLAPTHPTGVVASVVRSLKDMAGRKLLFIDGGSGTKVLIGSGPSLPEDFAPAIILDASGRVRTTYDLWEKYRRTLRRLPSAENDYTNLKIRLWQKASGKKTLENPASRSRIANGIAQVINNADGAEWLIVHYKGNQAIFDEVRGMVEDRPSVRLHSLTWGQHHGTNDFAHIPNVVVVGRQHYGEPGFHALGAAASGLPAEQLASLDIKDVARGEFKHHLLQALCRSAVRRTRAGKAGRCRAYVVTTGYPETEQAVRDTFPGCRLWEWPSVEAPMSGRRRQLADSLLKAFEDPSVGSVRKKDIRKGLELQASNLPALIEHAEFQDFMGRERIFSDGQHFVKHRVSFDPYPGGGWTAESDE